MPLTRSSKGGKGRPGIQLSAEDLERIGQLALSGASLEAIRNDCGVSRSGWQRLCQRNPAVRQVIDSAYKSIGYQANVEARYKALATEAEQRGEESAAEIDVECFTSEELQKIFTAGANGVSLANVHVHLGMPVLMCDALMRKDKRGPKTHERGVLHGVDLIARDVKEKDRPKPPPAAPIVLDSHVLDLMHQHCELLFSDDEDEEGAEQPEDLESMLQ